jgi:hypothetical protein
MMWDFMAQREEMNMEGIEWSDDDNDSEEDYLSDTLMRLLLDVQR